MKHFHCMLSFAISQQKIDKKSVVRQPHDKQGALSRRAFDFNAAAVTFRNFHGDGQPEAGSRRLPAAGFVRPVKAFENMGNVFFVNPDSLILNFNPAAFVFF